MNSCHITLVMHYLRAFLILSCTVIIHMLRIVSPVHSHAVVIGDANTQNYKKAGVPKILSFIR